ncbi:MAG: chemotaxis protein CheW [candidate division KSB1 bacterium]|nr:chemotaxis protein CheW [candidate division KSB1 bacterium]
MSRELLQSRPFLIFEAEGRLLAVRSESVRAVLGHREYEPAAVGRDGGFVGTICVRNEQIPVLDLRAYGVDEPPDPLCVYIVTDVGGQLVALLVDEVVDVACGVPSASCLDLGSGIRADVVEVETLIGARVHGRSGQEVIQPAEEMASAVPVGR